MLRIFRGEGGLDSAGHGDHVLRREPGVRVGFALLAGQERQTFRSVDDGAGGEDVGHEFFEARATDDDVLRLLDGAHLVDREGIVVDAGDGLGNERRDRQAAPGGDGPHDLGQRRGRGEDVGRGGVGLRGAAGKQQRQRQKDGKNPLFHLKSSIYHVLPSLY